jgi:hypothetical protein
LLGAIESAASAQGQTVAEWLAGNLPLDSRTEEMTPESPEEGAETDADKARAREVWLMQL